MCSNHIDRFFEKIWLRKWKKKFSSIRKKYNNIISLSYLSTIEKKIKKSSTLVIRKKKILIEISFLVIIGLLLSKKT